MDSDGGPAFARSGYSGCQNGMSLRDYFAAEAMQAHVLLALVVATMHGKGVTAEISLSPEKIAKGAYILADAMLAERAN